MTTSANPSRRFRQLLARAREQVRESSLGPAVAHATRTRRSIALLRRSGLFDVAYYTSQITTGRHPRDPIAHYVRAGAAAGLSPHPLFDPDFYIRTSRTARKSLASPFVEFLDRGCHRGDDPHPLFHTDAYLAQAPAAGSHPFGAFGHFLESDDPPWPNRDLPAVGVAPRRGRETYLALLDRVRSRHEEAPDFTDFQRTFDHFDHDAAREFVDAMRGVTSALAHHPRVSVIIPTKDRRHTVEHAIASVRNQTYPHWELVVVDDGGTDGTGDLVRALAVDDDRIRYVHQENTGVAGARNHGVALSAGELVSYLDSDNTWVPEFLETMVGFLHDSGLRAAYAASELRSEDRVEYRGRPLDVGALRERNYIDCITIVHDRELVEELGFPGPFDPLLRRVVDWDLLIRLSDLTHLGYAPFIATSYDLWDETGDRISHEESPGYRQVVRDKHLVAWGDAPEPVAGRLSTVVVARTPGRRNIPGTVDVVADLTSGGITDHEIIIVDNGLEGNEGLRLRALEALSDRVTVLRVADATSTAVARNLAASTATGDVLLLADPGVRLGARDLARLVGHVREHGPVLAQPVVMQADGTILSTGQVLGPRASAVTIGHELPADDAAHLSMAQRDGVDGTVFATDATTYRRLHGLDPLFLRGGSDLDLSLRARRDLDVPTLFVDSATARLTQHADPGQWSPTAPDREEFARRWRHHASRSMESLSPDGVAIEGLVPMAGESAVYPRRWAIRIREAGIRRRWAIKTSVPEAGVRHTWGDWHFACALRDALIELGQDVVVDSRLAWSRATSHLDDVNLVLRGTQRFEPRPDKLNLLWVISHPDMLTRYELEQYDQVYVASRSFPEQLARRWPSIEAHPLLQCTDADRFHPEPDPELHEPLLFVGNSRNILRAAVRDAIEAGLEPVVYGSNWGHLIPDRLVRGIYLPNDALRRHYASASVVLNDHWDDMRERGFISNRVFDAVASGARVVTDPVDGLEDIFGDRVVVYNGGPEDLARAVTEARSRPLTNREVIDHIAAEHTFRARAATLVETVERLCSEDRERASLTATGGDTEPLGRTSDRKEPVVRSRDTQAGSDFPVFVGGTGRSGTTIAGRLIGSSERFALVPIEIRLHSDDGGLADLMAGRTDVAAFRQLVMDKWYHRRPNNSGPRGLHVIASWLELQRALDRLEQEADDDMASAVGNFLRSLLDPVAERVDKPTWVEMTPPVASVAGSLGRAIPDARFVHMVRDGRDVATSVVQRTWGPDTMHEAIEWWTDSMIAIGRSTAHLPPDRILHLRMESLVGPEREKAFARLCDFLEIEADPGMRSFFEDNVSSERAREGRWRRGRDASEIADIEAWYAAALDRLAGEGITMPEA